MEDLAVVTDSICPLCAVELLLRARLESSRGRDRAAASLLDRWPQMGWGLEPNEVLMVLERGHVAERLGDRPVAIEKYQFVADSWRNADPELQKFVKDTKEGLVRLTGEPR
jgi:hypothetical protein